MQSIDGMNSLDITPEIMELLPDFASGPLDEYRRKASFNWRKMKLLIEGEEIMKFKMKFYRTLEMDPLFAHHPSQELSREEYVRVTFLRLKRFLEYDFLPDDHFIQNPALAMVLNNLLGQYDWSLCIKKSVAIDFVTMTLRGTGSSRHINIFDQISNFESSGCFMLTELGHGSNTKAMLTRADYDDKSNEFILNSPSLEAAKVWSGNLGKTATHAVVFAQLYVNGSCHGLSPFIVSLRDPKTLLPYPGITVGDMGPKIGLNGLDNGFLLFKDYRIPKDSLMNRLGDVNSEGKYVTEIKDDRKRAGVTLGTLSAGRVAIVGMSVANMQKCLPIAIRYSAARRQFGPQGKDEIPVIEYQMQQWRLLPYLAACYVIDNFSTSLLKDFINFQISVYFSVKTPELAEQGQEIHALSSGAKPLAGWICRDTIQECREACGGHGYLKAAALGDVRNDHDANCTYEGDNNVLQMQTSNYLIRLLKMKIDDGRPFTSPLGSVDFLDKMDLILQKRMRLHTPDDAMSMNFLIEAYQFLVSFLLRESVKKLNRELNMGHDHFIARSNCQVYYFRTLSLAYIEYAAIDRWNTFLNIEEVDESLSSVLRRIGYLYGLWSLEKHLLTLYQAGYCYEPTHTQYIRECILRLCVDLKDDAVALSDVIAPTDFILNSALGKSDGQIYKNIFDAMMSVDGATDRAQWWDEFCNNKPVIASLKPKL